MSQCWWNLYNFRWSLSPKLQSWWRKNTKMQLKDKTRIKMIFKRYLGLKGPSLTRSSLTLLLTSRVRKTLCLKASLKASNKTSLHKLRYSIHPLCFSTELKIAFVEPVPIQEAVCCWIFWELLNVFSVHMQINAFKRQRSRMLLKRLSVGLLTQLNIVRTLLKVSGKALSWLLKKGLRKILIFPQRNKHFQSNFFTYKSLISKSI